MVNTITKLRREKAILLSKAKNKNQFNTFLKQKSFEERKLRAEINALKNPKSTTASATAKKIALKFGRLSFRASVSLGKHLGTVAREQDKAERRKIKKGRKR